MILLDAGPLIALASPDDAHHVNVMEKMDQIHEPLVSTWPVLAEAAYVLRKRPDALQEMLAGFTSGVFELRDLGLDAIPWIADFLVRYRDIGAQLADASLMYVAEYEKIETIFTTDRRDFNVYRTRRNRALNIIP